MQLKWDTFWELIGSAVRADPIEHAAALEAALRERKWFEVVSFQSRFDDAARTANTSDLRAAALLVNGSDSETAFRDFLRWLVARGKPTYLRGIENPDSLAEVLTGDPVDAFGIDRAALRAYEALTGASDFFARSDRAPEPPAAELRLTEDEARERFPRLSELYPPGDPVAE
jgi:hypothetical protein